MNALKALVVLGAVLAGVVFGQTVNTATSTYPGYSSTSYPSSSYDSSYSSSYGSSYSSYPSSYSSSSYNSGYGQCDNVLTIERDAVALVNPTSLEFFAVIATAATTCPIPNTFNQYYANNAYNTYNTYGTYGSSGAYSTGYAQNTYAPTVNVPTPTGFVVTQVIAAFCVPIPPPIGPIFAVFYIVRLRVIDPTNVGFFFPTTTPFTPVFLPIAIAARIDENTRLAGEIQAIAQAKQGAIRLLQSLSVCYPQIVKVDIETKIKTERLEFSLVDLVVIFLALNRGIDSLGINAGVGAAGVGVAGGGIFGIDFSVEVDIEVIAEVGVRAEVALTVCTQKCNYNQQPYNSYGSSYAY